MPIENSVKVDLSYHMPNCHGEEPKATWPSMKDSFTNACTQYLEDHDYRPQGPGMFVYGMSLLLGQTTTRRLSNLFSCTGLPQFYPAQRDYPVLNSHQDLAAKFRPDLFTMNLEQTKDAERTPKEIRYEILPAQEDKNYYSVIYYVRTNSENLPLPVIKNLYSAARVVLFGNKHDWEAVQVDIDKKTLQPIGLNFETSNYSNPESFDLLSSKDMHLFTRVSKNPDGTWTQMVQQKSGKIQTSTVPDPFRESSHPKMAFVCWNGSFDTCDRVAQNQDLKLYPFETPEPKFLDIATYRTEGMDLRMTWLMPRKVGKFVSFLPAR